ncbi:hypothetical protein [Enteroccous phage Ef212]|nr:hypothetical protein [Enteroccous phage Ef212]
MSKFEGFIMACMFVVMASAIMILEIIVISILMTLKPIGWLILGLGALITIMITIGIYQYDKHF